MKLLVAVRDLPGAVLPGHGDRVRRRRLEPLGGGPAGLVLAQRAGEGALGGLAVPVGVAVGHLDLGQRAGLGRHLDQGVHGHLGRLVGHVGGQGHRIRLGWGRRAGRLARCRRGRAGAGRLGSLPPGQGVAVTAAGGHAQQRECRRQCAECAHPVRRHVCPSLPSALASSRVPFGADVFEIAAPVMRKSCRTRLDWSRTGNWRQRRRGLAWRRSGGCSRPASGRSVMKTAIDQRHHHERHARPGTRRPSRW